MEQKILIADDHSIIRNGLKLYLQYSLSVKDIHEVGSCHDLMKELIKGNYSHLILDMILSDGNSMEVIPNIRKVYPNLNIMVFSMQPEEVYGNALKQYGISLYLSKQVGEEEILTMLTRFVHEHKTVDNKKNGTTKSNPFSELAPRELEILHYLLKGIGTKDISDLLNLKMNTISTIKNRIYEKTNAHNIRELIDLATLYNVNY